MSASHRIKKGLLQTIEDCLEKHFRAVSTQAGHLNACSMNWSQGASSKKELLWMLRVWKRNILMIGRTRTESDSHLVRYMGYMVSMEPPQLLWHSSTDWGYRTAKPYHVSLPKSWSFILISYHTAREKEWRVLNHLEAMWQDKTSYLVPGKESSSRDSGAACCTQGGWLSTQIPRMPTAARGRQHGGRNGRESIGCEWKRLRFGTALTKIASVHI